MSKKPTKIDQIDLLRIKLHSALLDVKNERLVSLEWQKRNTETAKELVDARQQLAQMQAKEQAEVLDKLGAQFEEKYGVRDEKQVDWETGEIKSAGEVKDEASVEGVPGSPKRIPDPASQT